MNAKSGTSTVRGGRPRLHEVEGRQHHLLETAANMFILNGYSGTSLERIAATARVSKSTIYARYGGKKGLLEAVVDHVLKKNATPIDQPVHAPDGIAALKQQLANNIAASLQPAYIGLFRLFLAESAHFPEMIDAFSARGDAYRLLVRQLEQHREFADLLPYKDEIAYTLVCVTGMLVTSAVLQGDKRETIVPAAEASRLIDICMFGFFARISPAPAAHAGTATNDA